MTMRSTGEYEMLVYTLYPVNRTYVTHVLAVANELPLQLHVGVTVSSSDGTCRISHHRGSVYKPARESYHRDLRGLVATDCQTYNTCEPKTMTSNIFLYASYYKTIYI